MWKVVGIYLAGFCPYGERECWFNHNKENSIEYNCNFSEQICRSQSKLSHHIISCKKNINEECKYGRENCLFIHNTEESFNTNEHENENRERNGPKLNQMTNSIMRIQIKVHINFKS